MDTKHISQFWLAWALTHMLATLIPQHVVHEWLSRDYVLAVPIKKYIFLTTNIICDGKKVSNNNIQKLIVVTA